MLETMEMSGEHPLPAKGLFAALGSLLANLGVTLSIGGLDLVAEIFASPFVFQFLLIAALAAVIGFFLHRLPTVSVFLSGIVIGLLGSWIILIRIASNI